MKRAGILIISIFICKIAFSQLEIKVNESNESFEAGTNNALVVNIFEADAKEVEKEWKKLMKDYKAKVSSKKEVFADDATIKNISENTIDIYAYTKPGKDNDLQLVVGFDLGGAFLSSSLHPDKYTAAKKIVYNFAVNVTKEAIEGQQKEQEKVLKTMEKEKEDLIKAKEDLHKAIEDYKEKIAQAEKDIETNVKDQEEKVKEIETQQKVIEDIIAKVKAVK